MFFFLFLLLLYIMTLQIVQGLIRLFYDLLKEKKQFATNAQ